MAQPEMIRRQIATTATLARYRAKQFDWSRGCTCVHLARFHLRKMGHRPPTVPRFRSALSAKRALSANGWADVATMLDTFLPRITPAAMMLGDIAVIPGDGGLDSVFICATSHKLFGWTTERPEMAMVDVFGLADLTGAWRV